MNRTIEPRLKRDSALHQQTLGSDARSSNFLNYANYTAVDRILGTPQFTQSITADFGRRIESELVPASKSNMEHVMTTHFFAVVLTFVSSRLLVRLHSTANGS